jgi:hypothetical protein
MITRTILFTEYWFIPDVNGTDHLEGCQWAIEKVLGKGVVHFHNKKGGVLRLMFIGEMRTAQKANVLFQIEQECQLVFIDQKEVNYMAEYENNLKSMYGEKLAIK